MPHPNRNRFRLEPLSDQWAHFLPPTTVSNLEPIATIRATWGYFPSGILVRLKSSGKYAKYWLGGLANLDQRKIEAALKEMEATGNAPQKV